MDRNRLLPLAPYATLAWRDAKLNNYYYGVPGYDPAPASTSSSARSPPIA